MDIDWFRLLILTIAFISGSFLLILLERIYFRNKMNALFDITITIGGFTLTCFFTFLYQLVDNVFLNIAAYSCHIIASLSLYYFGYHLFNINKPKNLLILTILSGIIITLQFIQIEWILLIQIGVSLYIYHIIYHYCQKAHHIITSNQAVLRVNLRNIQKGIVCLLVATFLIISREILDGLFGINLLFLDTIGWTFTPFFAYYSYLAYIPIDYKKPSPLLQIQELTLLNNELQQMVYDYRVSDKELQDRVIELRKMNQIRMEFFASFSHELRTPMNSIIGFTQMLFDNQIDPITPNQKDILGDILVSGKHLLSIIENVLDISKMDSGKFTITSAEIDLPLMMAEVKQICDFRSRQKQINLLFPLIPPIKIWGDFQRLKQVLINLIDNAIKFSPIHATIDIGVIMLNGDICFKVIDHGIGISPEKIPTLFHPYQCVETYAQKGWGMGLYYSKQIVDLHKGKINISSELNKGTTVTIIIPRSEIK